MADIIIENLCKSFGEKRVLADFSAEFKDGSVTCIMGESGCGKTTLLNILMGLLPADSGSISGVPERFSAVFQEDRLVDTVSAVTNVHFAVGGEVSLQTIEEHLGKVGLEGSQHAKAGELSGGMKRRTAIVRCVLAKGELMILDEPFKGLDEENRAKAAEYILENRRDRTVIVVTHDIDEVNLLGADVLTMTAN